jgi:3-deoxy-D-manno-octulosonate 8-phosphate phosphatase (KDO 8-P phosphatase)
MDLRKLKFIVCDVDGTLTDGGMYITSQGNHFKRFNTKDGMAVKILYQNGFHVGIISHSKTSKMVTERANMLNIKHCYVGEDNKLSVLKKWIKELGISLEEVAFLGDDNNDKNIMEKVGVSVCPSDSSNEILNIADIILRNKGGDACLREFVENHLGLD